MSSNWCRCFRGSLYFRDPATCGHMHGTKPDFLMSACRRQIYWVLSVEFKAWQISCAWKNCWINAKTVVFQNYCTLTELLSVDKLVVHCQNGSMVPKLWCIDKTVVLWQNCWALTSYLCTAKIVEWWQNCCALTNYLCSAKTAVYWQNCWALTN